MLKGSSCFKVRKVQRCHARGQGCVCVCVSGITEKGIVAILRNAYFRGKASGELVAVAEAP
jgi:hypothetical protein